MYLHPVFARALGEETRAEHLRRAARSAPTRRPRRFRFRRRASTGDRAGTAEPAGAPVAPARA